VRAPRSIHSSGQWETRYSRSPCSANAGVNIRKEIVLSSLLPARAACSHGSVAFRGDAVPPAQATPYCESDRPRTYLSVSQHPCSYSNPRRDAFSRLFIHLMYNTPAYREQCDAVGGTMIFIEALLARKSHVLRRSMKVTVLNACKLDTALPTCG